MNWKILLAVLAVSCLFMSSSYTMLIPFLPLYLTQELGVTEDANMWSGAVFSVTFLLSAVMAPVWGMLADRGSRKLMAIRSACLLALTYTLGGFVQTPFQLFLVRMLQGVAAGLWPALLSIMSSNCPQQKLGLSMGILQGAMTAGGVIGPLMGGVLAQYLGMRTSFYMGGFFLFLITLMLIFVVKEPPRETLRKKAVASGKKTSLFAVPVLRDLLLCAGLTQASVTVAMPIFTYYVAQLMGTEENLVAVSGYVFAVLGIAGIFASPFWGWLGQSIGFRPVLLISMFFAGLLGAISALPQALGPFVVIRFIGGIAFAGIFPAINAMLTRYSASTDRGRVFGVSFSVQQTGSIAGPLIGGLLASAWSLQGTMIFAGLVQLVAFGFLWMCSSHFAAADTEKSLGVPKHTVSG